MSNRHRESARGPRERTTGRKSRASAALCALLLGISAATLADDPSTISYEIAPQAVSTALKVFAAQSGLQLLFVEADVSGKQTKGISGDMAPVNALAAILSGTDLDFEFTANEVVIIRKTGPESQPNTSPGLLRNATEANGAPAEEMDRSSSPSSREEGAQSRESRKVVANDHGLRGEVDRKLEEIIVTGTNIRGISNATSPPLVFERQQIEATGFYSTEQLVQSLTQNFGGGNSSSTIGGVLGGEKSASNLSQGTGINLRGLGNDATLVLINGTRMAPSGVGNFVDLSLIPLNVVERIEVLTDGASAIYGSDAIAGVVNIILRKDAEGVETRARYGTVTSGSHEQYQLSQSFGGAWDSGSGFLALQRHENTDLTATDRDFTQNAGVTDLIPSQLRDGIIGSLTQHVGSDVTLNGMGIYSNRESSSDFSSGGTVIRTNSEATQVAAALGLIWNGDDWSLEVKGSGSRSETLYNPLIGGLPAGDYTGNSETSSLKVASSGVLPVPVGAEKIRVAIGADFRHESYSSSGTFLRTPGELDRDVGAAFAELYVPLTGLLGVEDGAQKVDLSLAVRAENYSDFGSTSDPKIGISWTPDENLSVRASWGTSFRAPLLSETFEELTPRAYTLPDPSAPSGQTLGIIVFGNNPHLNPETAEIWTAGLDFEPIAHPGLSLSLTYFSIDFRDRVLAPLPVGTTLQVLQQENLFAQFISRDPDVSAVDALMSSPRFSNFTGVEGMTAEDIAVVVDNKLQNIARRSQDGLDFNLRYQTETRFGNVGLEVNGSYLFSIENQIATTFPTVDLVDTVPFPVDVRIRSGASLSREHWNINAYVNYVDDYRNIRVSPEERVASWTTFDVGVQYEVPESDNLFSGMELSMFVHNLFDAPPPLVPNDFNLNYDATNASPVGRMISLGLRKGW